MLFSLRLSFQVAALATGGVLIAGVGMAYVLAMKNFRGKELIDMILTLPLVLPPTVTGYFLIILFGRNGVIGRPVYEVTGWQIMFTWQAAVLASFVVSLPLMIKTSRAAIESVDKKLDPGIVYTGTFSVWRPPGRWCSHCQRRDFRRSGAFICASTGRIRGNPDACRQPPRQDRYDAPGDLFSGEQW